MDGLPRVLGRHRFPARTLARTTVLESVHPTEPVVPQNLLRFYLTFSAPMSRGAAQRHVRVEDADGRTVAGAFLPLEDELWDPSGRRLTLLFDPGRIKRGLARNRDLGAPLQADRSYTLVVDAAWEDARGAPLARGLRHAFTTTDPDRTQPDAGAWTLDLPRAGTRAELAVRFEEPLDHALLQRLLALTGPTGEPVPGSATVQDGERTWRFRPDAPWAAGEHVLRADPRLEDRAGNSFASPFEVPATAPAGLFRRPSERRFRIEPARP